MKKKMKIAIKREYVPGTTRYCYQEYKFWGYGKRPWSQRLNATFESGEKLFYNPYPDRDYKWAGSV